MSGPLFRLTTTVKGMQDGPKFSFQLRLPIEADYLDRFEEAIQWCRDSFTSPEGRQTIPWVAHQRFLSISIYDEASAAAFRLRWC